MLILANFFSCLDIISHHMARRGDLTLDLTNLPLFEDLSAAGQPSMRSAVAPLTPTPSPTSTTTAQRFQTTNQQKKPTTAVAECPIDGKLVHLNISGEEQQVKDRESQEIVGECNGNDRAGDSDDLVVAISTEDVQLDIAPPPKVLLPLSPGIMQPPASLTSGLPLPSLGGNNLLVVNDATVLKKTPPPSPCPFTR